MCGEFGLSQDSDDVVELKAPYCRRYGCDECLPIVRRELQRRIRAGQPNKLFTLTTRFIEGACPIEEAGKQMKAWNALITRIRRHFGNEVVEFLHVKEGTKKGWPHLHVVARMPSLDHTLLRRWWQDLTGSFQIDIRAVTSIKGVAKYLAKYLTKDLTKFGTYRVWSCSRGWDLDRKPKEKTGHRAAGERWQRIPEGMTGHRAMLRRAGYFEIWLSPRHWKYYDPHDWPEWAYSERWRREAETKGWPSNLIKHC